MSQQEMAVDLPLVNRRSFSARNFLVDNSAKEIIFIEIITIVIAYNLGIDFSPYRDKLLGSHELVFISVLHAVLTVACNIGLGGYEFTERFNLGNIVFIGSFAQIIAFFLSVAITYLGFYSTFGRLSIIYGVISSLIAVFIFKLILRAHILKNPYIISTIGNSSLMQKIQERCKRAHLGYRCLPIEMEWESTARLLSAIEAKGARTVIVGSGITQHQNFVDFSLAAAELGITVSDELEFYTYLYEHIPIDHINKRWLFNMGLLRPSTLYLAGKRVFDIIFSLVCLLVFAPVILLIAIAIKATSKGPVFFVQQRIGRYSKIFNIYKFRTMKYVAFGQQNESFVTSKNDCRVTLLGKIIRPLHLDELPQLFNILKGEMSFVGIRPETIAYGQQMQEKMPVYHLRDLYRPGITGHAQLSMHYPMHTLADTKNKLGYDFYYLMNQGLILDLKILFKTFFKFFLQ